MRKSRSLNAWKARCTSWIWAGVGSTAEAGRGEEMRGPKRLLLLPSRRLTLKAAFRRDAEEGKENEVDASCLADGRVVGELFGVA